MGKCLSFVTTTFHRDARLNSAVNKVLGAQESQMQTQLDIRDNNLKYTSSVSRSFGLSVLPFPSVSIDGRNSESTVMAT